MKQNGHTCFKSLSNTSKILGLYSNIIISVKSLGIMWGNSYIKFFMLGIKFRFQCDELKLYYNFLKFPNTISRIVVRRKPRRKSELDLKSSTADLMHSYTFHRRSKKPGRQCSLQQENWVEIQTILLTLSGIIIRFEHSWIINIHLNVLRKTIALKILNNSKRNFLSKFFIEPFENRNSY